MTSNGEFKENIMLTVQDSNTESSSPSRFARATIMVLALVGAGYAMSTQLESAVDSSKGGITEVAQAGQQDLAPTAYFPAQYVNQGKTVEEHIQAF
jgi:hypothetical protein